MNIAVFSDIHGNHVAFEACLNYALSHDVTTFLFLGDYLGEFAYPQKTMEMIYELKEKYNCYFIKGNKEDYWINRKYDNNCEWKDGNLTVGAMLYCYANQTE
ncbi:MAG: metallophosphoesterase, partial [Lachnospiraceae bacterium]|nr:metallophosphoesterase [Lachnospiraceae bacterium]